MPGSGWRARLCSAAGSTSLASVVASATMRPLALEPAGVGGRGTRLEHGRRCDHDLRRIVRLKDAPPALLGRRVGIGQIAAPQRQADSRAQHERRPLAGGHSLELEQSPTDELRGLFVRARFDEHQTQIEDRAEPGDAGRRKLHRRAALGLCLASSGQG